MTLKHFKILPLALLASGCDGFQIVMVNQKQSEGLTEQDTGLVEDGSSAGGAADEICGDGADNDGDGLYDCQDPDCEQDESCSVADEDGDGYAADEGDCDDDNGWIHPALPEVCDGLDNNCDGVVDEDCVEVDIADIAKTECSCSAAGIHGAPWLWLSMLVSVMRRRRHSDHSTKAIA